MRDPDKLTVFQIADALAGEVYSVTNAFPPAEKYGLTNQIRRAAVSVPSNLVEGCSRESVVEFRRFVEIALGSAMELHYQLGFALRMKMATDPETTSGLTNVVGKASALCKSLNSFIRALRSESQEPSAKSQGAV